MDNLVGNTVPAIDTTDETLLTNVSVGDGPDDFQRTSVLNRHYVNNRGSGAFSIIHTVTGNPVTISWRRYGGHPNPCEQ